jgi:hypothetical protein
MRLGSPLVAAIARRLPTACVLSSLAVALAHAQQITGVPGSPGATITLVGKQLPPPDPTFGGVINERASESTPWWPPRVVPPKGAANVLLITVPTSSKGH